MLQVLQNLMQKV